MVVRIKSSKQDEVPDEPIGQKRRPDHNQFRLQVDRQTKASYPTFEAAEAAGKALKTSYPVVQVGIYDAVTNEISLIEVAAA